MKKIIILGNSGSGKSTLAAKLCESEGLAHLDMDTLAWLPVNPPQRRPIEESQQEIDRFLEQNDSWVIEGCYTDLLELVAPVATKIIFMNLPIAACQQNARQRAWEPHKYASKEAQDRNLPMLLDWIAKYSTRQDEFSQAAHQELFEQFPGAKIEVTSNF